ncbi:Protein of unknown function, partial [Gryllus bimaculatus]
SANTAPEQEGSGGKSISLRCCCCCCQVQAAAAVSWAESSGPYHRSGSCITSDRLNLIGMWDMKFETK